MSLILAIGSLSRFYGTRSGMTLLVAQLGLVLLFAYFYSGYHSSDRCIRCHADKDKMQSLGYPQFVMTREQVRKEARHPNTECRDCHLGNGLSDNPGKAHRRMLKLIVPDYDLNIISRKGGFVYLPRHFRVRPTLSFPACTLFCRKYH